MKNFVCYVQLDTVASQPTSQTSHVFSDFINHFTQSFVHYISYSLYILLNLVYSCRDFINFSTRQCYCVTRN